MRAACLTVFLALALAPWPAGAFEPKREIEVGPVTVHDLRGPYRIGVGTTRLFTRDQQPTLSMSFEDQIDVARLGPRLDAVAVWGMDVLTAPDAPRLVVDGDARSPGVLSVVFGGGLTWRIWPEGPFAVGTLALGPGWFSGNDDVAPQALTVTARAELYPFYKTIQESLRRDGAWMSSYVMSAISVWALSRQDFLGARHQTSMAAGVSVEIGRLLLVPALTLILKPK